MQHQVINSKSSDSIDSYFDENKYHFYDYPSLWNQYCNSIDNYDEDGYSGYDSYIYTWTKISNIESIE